ncbi:hypothetical protein KR084_002258 [Drosophila pseudotakahashii]|nr:hypothetical protein KR084_002258 [Drosophila pseudotakahashii]
MFKSAKYILCSLVVLALQGSWADFEEGGYGPRLPEPFNRCGQFCFNKLDPMQNQLASIEGKLLDLESTLNALWAFHQDQPLVATQSEIKYQMQELQTGIQNKLTKLVLKVYAELERQLSVLQDSLRNLVTKTDFEARVNATQCQISVFQSKNQRQLIALQQQIEIQQTSFQELLVKTNLRFAPPKFEKLGSRFFYFEHNTQQNWTTAANSCRQMGGYLAAIQNEQELNAITGMLHSYKSYWLGINDIEKEGEYVSVASGKRAPFLKWSPYHPNHLDNNQDCVMYNREMFDNWCKEEYYFICQWDNEV